MKLNVLKPYLYLHVNTQLECKYSAWSWASLYPFPLLTLSLSLRVYRIRLVWLPLCYLDSTQPAAQLVEHLPRKQYVVGLNPT